MINTAIASPRLNYSNTVTLLSERFAEMTYKPQEITLKCGVLPYILCHADGSISEEKTQEAKDKYNIKAEQTEQGISLAINVSVMAELGMITTDVGKRVLERLTRTHETKDSTIWMFVPRFANQTAQQALVKITTYAKQGIPVFMTGWYSTPDTWFFSVDGKGILINEDESREIPMDMIHRMHVKARGQSTMFIGIAGLGCVTEDGFGSPPIEGELTLKYDVDDYLSYLHTICSYLGITPSIIIGHSLAGRNAKYAFEKYFFGIPVHSLNPANLVKDINSVKNGIFAFLAWAHTEKLRGIGKALAHIKLNVGVQKIDDATSLIAKMVGYPKGTDVNAMQTDSHQTKLASDKLNPITNALAMANMAHGQSEETMIHEPFSEQHLSTISTASDDFFVNSKSELSFEKASLTVRYAKRVEDVGINGKSLSVNDALGHLYLERQLLPRNADGGHYNFWDIRYREQLFFSIFETLEEQEFHPEIFSLAALVITQPVMLRIAIGDEQISDMRNIVLKVFSQSTQHAVQINVTYRMYERVRILLEIVMNEESMSTCERYTSNKRKQLVLEQLSLDRIHQQLYGLAFSHFTEAIKPTLNRKSQEYAFCQSVSIIPSAEKWGSDLKENYPHLFKVVKATQSDVRRDLYWLGVNLGSLKSKQVPALIEALKLTAKEIKVAISDTEIELFIEQATTQKWLKLGTTPKKVLGSINVLLANFFAGHVFDANSNRLVETDYAVIEHHVRNQLNLSNPLSDFDDEEYFSTSDEGTNIVDTTCMFYKHVCASLIEALKDNELFQLVACNATELNNFYLHVFDVLKNEVVVIE